MEEPISQLTYIPADQLEMLTSGLWGTVSRIKGKDVIVKVAKNAENGLLEIEKKCFERLGPNERIARYLGAARVEATDGERTGLLFEYYPLGSLQEFFNQPASLTVRNSKAQQIRWCTQILEGLAHIHSNGIVHGDFAIRNMLVATGYDLKMADFGGSSIDGAEMQVECSPKYHRPHSWRFPIPGVDDSADTWKIPTKVADTFAVGTILFEVFTGTQLYKNLTYDEIRRHATKREYPDIQVIEIPEIRVVIANCWGEKYSSVQDIVRDLRPIWKDT